VTNAVRAINAASSRSDSLGKCRKPDQALERPYVSRHTVSTCGQSRGGGFATSNRARRSKCFGRVAVTHVQGSPKGGGALCVRRVANTRLAPVPPRRLGAQ